MFNYKLLKPHREYTNKHNTLNQCLFSFGSAWFMQGLRLVLLCSDVYIALVWLTNTVLYSMILLKADYIDKKH